jgi:hypothetical protein
MVSEIVKQARALTDADAVEKFLGELELARHVALERLAATKAPAPSPWDDVLTLSQAATLLDSSERWTREHFKDLGGRRIGRKLVFSRSKLLGARK